MSFLSRLFGGKGSGKGPGDLEKRLANLEAEAETAAPGYVGTAFNRAGDVALRGDETARAVGYYGRAIDSFLDDGQREAARGVANKIIRVRPGAVRTLCTLTWLDLAARHSATALLHLRDYVEAAKAIDRTGLAASQVYEMARIVPESEFVGAVADALDVLDFSNLADEVREWMKSDGSPEAIRDPHELAEACLHAAVQSSQRGEKSIGDEAVEGGDAAEADAEAEGASEAVESDADADSAVAVGANASAAVEASPSAAAEGDAIGSEEGAAEEAGPEESEPDESADEGAGTEESEPEADEDEADEDEADVEEGAEPEGDEVGADEGAGAEPEADDTAADEVPPDSDRDEASPDEAEARGGDEADPEGDAGPVGGGEDPESEPEPESEPDEPVTEGDGGGEGQVESDSAAEASDATAESASGSADGKTKKKKKKKKKGKKKKR